MSEEIDLKITMVDLVVRRFDLTYELKEHSPQASSVTAIVWNPGEDVFLVLTNDSNVFLFTVEETQPKIIFER